MYVYSSIYMLVTVDHWFGFFFEAFSFFQTCSILSAMFACSHHGEQQQFRLEWATPANLALSSSDHWDLINQNVTAPPTRYQI